MTVQNFVARVTRCLGFVHSCPNHYTAHRLLYLRLSPGADMASLAHDHAWTGISSNQNRTSPWPAAWVQSAAWWGSAYVHSSLEDGHLIECCVSWQGHGPPPGSSRGDVMEPAWLQHSVLGQSAHSVKHSLQFCSQLHNILWYQRNKPHATALFTCL